MTQALTHTYTLIHEHRRRITTALFATCMMMALIYAINLYRVISHTIALQKINSAQALLDSNIQKLDTKYLSLSSRITPDTLHTYGFNKGTVSAFISRTDSLGRVAMAGHEL